ncbi:MAG: hypothetical protein LBD48_04765 [Treponema sp.]|jgi:hypothetical protein|nr:hypothetical protein [Treponema sp.]
MRVKVKRPRRQALTPYPRFFALVFAALCLCFCNVKKEETPVIPPATSPLSRPIVGFGVVNVSYTHVTLDPSEGSASPGYLRKGSLVLILERRMVKNGKTIEAWVLADGNYRGWLKESAVDIYDNELRAKTASESMSR